MFTWKPIYAELCQKLLPFREHNCDLVKILEQMRADGLTVTPLQDKDTDGNAFTIKEMDPFTFLGTFNRGIRPDNRTAILQRLKNDWQLSSPLPDDYDGIPIMDLRNSWFMPYQAKRKKEHVALLWDFFGHVLRLSDVSHLDTDLFDRCRALFNVGLTYLTMGMFWVRPDTCAALDRKSVAYANSQGIGSNPKNGRQYADWVSEVTRTFGDDICRFSLQAHLFATGELKTSSESSSPPVADPQYWLLAPGNEGNLWDEWKSTGIAAIGWPDVGDLDAYESKAEIADAVSEAYPDDGPKQCASMLWDFRQNMRVGDVVFAKKGLFKVLGWGIVTGDYRYDSKIEPKPNLRAVVWKKDQLIEVPEGMQLPGKTLTPMTGKDQFLDVMRKHYENVPGLDSEMVEIIEEGERNWWLNANPAIWDPSSSEVGLEMEYSAFAENGKPKKSIQAFQIASPGDSLLIYCTTPMKYLWGRGTITAGLSETDGQLIRLRIDKKFTYPVSFDIIKSDTLLARSVPVLNHHGTLFPLNPAEHQRLLELADTPPETSADPVMAYSMANALQDLFMPKSQLVAILDLLKFKKNLILQGAPGTGKTFLARRLAYLLMGQQDESRVQMVQFHQSMTYEDFIQGYRPDGAGGFKLRNGIFYEFCQKALLQPEQPFIFIIDEINRGNLSKIFGELLMLIETDKRAAKYAVPMTYASDGDKFYVPSNVHLIGMMNTADRSLSLVDYALRRRFAFVDLEPQFDSDAFEVYVLSRGLSQADLQSVRKRMQQLNKLIEDDGTNLGKGFRIGHSFFVPNGDAPISAGWIQQVLLYELLPLLEEYWSDDAKQYDQARKILLGSE